MKLIPALTLLAALALRPPGADAKGDNAGDLGAAGHVRGDISRDAGETDRVTVTLDQGAALTVRFAASFMAHLAVSGPDGMPVDVGLTDGRRTAVVGHPVETGGRYEVAISSVDGSQGLYSLLVKQTWPRTFTVAGAGRQVMDVAMPAGGKLACVVRPGPGAAGHPEIVALTDPADAALLTSPIVATHGAARLPATQAADAGVYHLTVDATDGTSPWKTTVARAVPAAARASLDLRNGLDPLSFRADGVGAIFFHRCTPCHAWASGYSSVRSQLSRALPRITGRSMPPGGGLSDREIALILAWVRTGKAP